MDTILAKKLFYIRFAQCKQSENLKLHLFHTSQSEKKNEDLHTTRFPPTEKRNERLSNSKEKHIWSKPK